MSTKIAIVGAGRMGGFLSSQLPAGTDSVIIDVHEHKAKAMAEKFGFSYSASAKAASDADIVATALPAPNVADAFSELAANVKLGAIVLNMSTEAVVSEDFKKANPGATFVNAKIVGHANSMINGLPGYLIVDVDDAAVVEKIRIVMPGFAAVMPGDTSLVPIANKIGSGEGIATAVTVRKKLRESGVPEQWADIVISTV